MMQGGASQRVFTPNEFLQAAKLAHADLPGVVHALSADHLVHKVAGYADTLSRTSAAAAAPAALGDAIEWQQGNAQRKVGVQVRRSCSRVEHAIVHCVSYVTCQTSLQPGTCQRRHLPAGCLGQAVIAHAQRVYSVLQEDLQMSM
jgi:hypothetical protein